MAIPIWADQDYGSASRITNLPDPNADQQPATRNFVSPRAGYGMAAAGLLPAGTDWNITTLIPQLTDPTNAGLQILSAHESTAQARGWLQLVPAGATQMRITFWYAARTAPAGTRYIRPRIAYRKINHNAAVGSWAYYEVGDLSVPTNTYWQRASQTFNLTDPTTDIDADNLYQFEVSFHNATTGTKLTSSERKILYLLTEFL